VVERLSVADYDKLTPDEQKAHDAALAKQEAEEQAGNLTMYFSQLKLILMLS
jgi:hypothetical protein